MSSIKIRQISQRDPTTSPPDHHIGNPPTSFRNPWPSADRPSPSLTSMLSLKMGWGDNKHNFVPVPTDRSELVQIRTPDFGIDKPHSLRATWFGHASFLIELPKQGGAERGVRILLDPVFAEQMGPMSRLGPKRFSPLPCSLEEVPDVDLVLISHSHYDHLDVDVVRQLHASRGRNVHFLCGLNLKKWFVSCGISEEDVTELDWWDEIEVDVEAVGSVMLACTPAQHASARTPTDRNHALWCSWVIRSTESNASEKRLFFAGKFTLFFPQKNPAHTNGHQATLATAPSQKKISTKTNPPFPTAQPSQESESNMDHLI